MTRLRCTLLLGTLAAAAVASGCGGQAALVRQADATCEALSVSSDDRAPATLRRSAAVQQTLFFAARQETPATDPVGDPATAEPAAAAPTAPIMPGAEGGEFPAIQDRSMASVLVDDLKAMPRRVLVRGMKHTYAKPENLLILGTAFGVDRIVRHNWDGEVRDELRYNDTSLAETGDFGSVIGNPALHFGVAGAWYLTSLRQRDQEQYAKSRTLLQALMVNGLSTVALKLAMDDESPNDERWGWPSGHASSSVCLASVMHAYYGWKVGAPLYLLAGYSAATRLEDREHDLSDLIFGASLGFVVGHSVVNGELPQVAGFHVLPYGGRNAGGLMFMKSW